MARRADDAAIQTADESNKETAEKTAQDSRATGAGAARRRGSTRTDLRHAVHPVVEVELRRRGQRLLPLALLLCTDNEQSDDDQVSPDKKLGTAQRQSKASPSKHQHTHGRSTVRQRQTQQTRQKGAPPEAGRVRAASPPAPPGRAPLAPASEQTTGTGQR